MGVLYNSATGDAYDHRQTVNSNNLILLQKKFWIVERRNLLELFWLKIRHLIGRPLDDDHSDCAKALEERASWKIAKRERQRERQMEAKADEWDDYWDSGSQSERMLGITRASTQCTSTQYEYTVRVHSTSSLYVYSILYMGSLYKFTSPV